MDKEKMEEFMDKAIDMMVSNSDQVRARYSHVKTDTTLVVECVETMIGVLARPKEWKPECPTSETHMIMVGVPRKVCTLLEKLKEEGWVFDRETVLNLFFEKALMESIRSSSLDTLTDLLTAELKNKRGGFE